MCEPGALVRAGTCTQLPPTHRAEEPGRLTLEEISNPKQITILTLHAMNAIEEPHSLLAVHVLSQLLRARGATRSVQR